MYSCFLRSAERGIRTHAPETGLKHFECSLLDLLSSSACPIQTTTILSYFSCEYKVQLFY